MLSDTPFAPAPLYHTRKSPLDYLSLQHALPCCSAILGRPNILDSALCPMSSVVLRLCACYALRVGEVLRLKVSDVIRADRIVVQGEKGSASCVVLLPGITYAIHKAAIMAPADLLFPCGYQYIYRRALQARISMPRQKGSNKIVTHIGRYTVVDEAGSILQVDNLGDVLRHKVSQNVQYYLNY